MGDFPLRHLTLLALALVAGLAFALARTASAEDAAPPPTEPVDMPAAPATDAADAPEAPPLVTPAVEALADEERLLRPRSGYLLAAIGRQRDETWRWQRLMGKRATPFSNSARRSRDPAYRRWVLRLWKKRAAQARRAAASPPRRGAWLCIQRHEGAWNDPSPPYYGGLQMDISFQRAYGSDLLRRKGTANRWTPVEQMWVAERAFRSGRGFYPWPNTARYCGLL